MNKCKYCGNKTERADFTTCGKEECEKKYLNEITTIAKNHLDNTILCDACNHKLNPITDWYFTKEKNNPKYDIAATCDWLKEFLLEKNDTYGSAVFEPSNIFSKLSNLEGVKVRIDDKLKRFKHGKEYPGDDTVKDLAGYLIIYLTILRAEGKSNE